jgi:hypothetical protein
MDDGKRVKITQMVIIQRFVDPAEYPDFTPEEIIDHLRSEDISVQAEAVCSALEGTINEPRPDGSKVSLDTVVTREK